LRERGQFLYFDGPVNSAVFSRDGRTLAVGFVWGGRIVLWDQSMSMRFPKSILAPHPNSNIESLSFSSDDTLLASGEKNGRVRLWDVRSGGLLASMEGQAGRVWCVTFAPDGTQLATAGQDGIVKLWHVLGDDRRTIRISLENRTIAMDWVAFSPDGQTLFTRTNSGELGRWGTFSGRRVQPAGVPRAWAAALAPGSRLATIEGDKRDLRVQELSGAAGQVYRHGQTISGLAISPDGERVAFADDSHAVWMWEIGSGRTRELSQLSGVCKCLAFAPDGRTIAIMDAARVLLLDTDRGHSIMVLSGHEKEVQAIVFSPDGRLLATAARDNTIRIWEFPSGRKRYCLWQPRTDLMAIAFSPDAKTLASGTSKGEVILWDVAGGQELMRLDDHRETIFSLAFSPDGKVLAAGGSGTDAKSAEVTLWYTDGARPSPDP
jgi:WD40 repeat protein